MRTTRVEAFRIRGDYKIIEAPIIVLLIETTPKSSAIADLNVVTFYDGKNGKFWKMAFLRIT